MSLSDSDSAIEDIRFLFGDDDASSEPDEAPPVAFYFKVVIGDKLSEDNSFQEVSGIQSEIVTEPVEEGGSPFSYALPLKIKNSNLVLKRGVAKKGSLLATWCISVMEGGGFARPITPANVQVFLMNEKGDAIRKWNFVNAYPVKWEVESFSSTKNDLAIERIELSYTLVKREM